MTLRSRFFAMTYDRQMTKVEKAGLRAYREGLLASAAGQVLEIGAGTGFEPALLRPGRRVADPDRARDPDAAPAGAQGPHFPGSAADHPASTARVRPPRTAVIRPHLPVSAQPPAPPPPHDSPLAPAHLDRRSLRLSGLTCNSATWVITARKRPAPATTLPPLLVITTVRRPRSRPSGGYLPFTQVKTGYKEQETGCDGKVRVRVVDRLCCPMARRV